MHRTIRTLAALATAGVGLLVGAVPSSASSAAPCAPNDSLCTALAPVLEPQQPPPAPSSTSPTTTTTAAAPAAALAPSSVEAAGGGATAAGVELAGAAVPAVPVGLALELPPVTIPDFGGPAPVPPPAPVARRPLRSEVGDVLTGRPAPAPGPDPAQAVALAVGVPALLVALSLLARHRGAAPPPLAGP